jgi:hypothetical protein
MQGGTETSREGKENRRPSFTPPTGFDRAPQSGGLDKGINTEAFGGTFTQFACGSSGE